MMWRPARFPQVTTWHTLQIMRMIATEPYERPRSWRKCALKRDHAHHSGALHERETRRARSATARACRLTTVV